VAFPDPGLDAAVRAAIGKHTGDILDTDLSALAGLSSLTWLNLLGKQIQDITDITPLVLFRAVGERPVPPCPSRWTSWTWTSQVPHSIISKGMETCCVSHDLDSLIAAHLKWGN
jgi:hypothetical protein